MFFPSNRIPLTGRVLPHDCQVVLFSATYKEEVREFAERVVPNANMISLKREELSVDAIKQLYLDCPNAESKYETLCSIYGLCNIGQSIIFCHVRILYYVHFYLFVIFL
jgi:superfamily II DNA/RNA helicase